MRRAIDESFEETIRRAARLYIGNHPCEPLPCIIPMQGGKYFEFAAAVMAEVERLVDIETVIGEEFVKL